VVVRRGKNSWLRMGSLLIRFMLGGFTSIDFAFLFVLGGCRDWDGLGWSFLLYIFYGVGNAGESRHFSHVYRPSLGGTLL